MLARAHTFTIDGPQARHVTVEVDIRAGLPAFTIVGLADAAVREARERVQTAIRNSRLSSSRRGGSPPTSHRATCRKAGPGLDLAIACALLAASGQLPRERLERPRAVRRAGARRRACAPAAARWRSRRPRGAAASSMLVLAGARAREAALVDGLERRAVVERCAAPCACSAAERQTALPAGAGPTTARGPGRGGPDLSEVRGQHHAVQALMIAAAGGHNLPAQRPAGDRQDDARPAACRRSCRRSSRARGDRGDADPTASRRRPRRELLSDRARSARRITRSRPPGLIGGARRGWVGEVVLAHNGVLFLDELSEFSRPALEALRQPLEDGRVAIVRARHSAIYPTRFMLVAATNPCPCGYAGEASAAGAARPSWPATAAA